MHAPRAPVASDPRAAAAWWLAAVAVGVALAGAFGEHGVASMLPALRATLDWLAPWADVHRLAQDRGDGQLRIAIRLEAVQWLSIGVRPIPPRWGLDVAVTAGALWQPPIVALATAAAWPAPTRARVAAAMLALVLATAGAIALLALAATGLALGGVHGQLAADQPLPFVARLPRFLEAGGRLLAGFVIGIGAVAAVAASAQAVRWLRSGPQARPRR